MNEVMRDCIAQAVAGTLAAAFRDLPNGAEELRVAVSACDDTTAHTLAWLLESCRATTRVPGPGAPFLGDQRGAAPLPGRMGGAAASSRVYVEFDGTSIRRRTLVLYSPYLTHRDPGLWTDPLSFRPERFERGAAAWGFIPFAAGERTCLGRSFAHLVLSTVLDALADVQLRFIAGDMRPRAGLTLCSRRGPVPGAEPVLTKGWTSW